MQVKSQHSLFLFYGQDKPRDLMPVVAQFPTVHNVTARIRFAQDEHGTIADMCEPDKIVLGDAKAWGVPTARYALLQLVYARFCILGKFRVRSGLIGEDGSRVGPSAC